MTRSPEERLSGLEENFDSMKEGLARLEKTLERIDAVLSGLVERLDVRYPTRESVDLRVEDLRKDMESVRKQADESKTRIDRMQRWQYQVTGAVTLAAFLLGLLARGFKG